MCYCPSVDQVSGLQYTKDSQLSDNNMGPDYGQIGEESSYTRSFMVFCMASGESPISTESICLHTNFLLHEKQSYPLCQWFGLKWWKAHQP